MMKDYRKHRFYQKNIALIYILVLVLGTVASLAIPKYEQAAAVDPLVIPNEAIRLRILANSDSEKDQEVKREIRDAVNDEINRWVEELTSIEDARHVMTSRLDEIEEIAQQILKEKGFDYSLNVEFGKAQFPTKLYGQFLYPAGTYEAIVITLGKGNGANWWCVLFPPLCFLDFSNSLAVSEGIEESGEEQEKIEEKEKKQTKKAKEKKETKPENEQLEADSEVVDKNVDKTAEAPIVVDDESEVEVKFFLVELFNKIF